MTTVDGSPRTPLFFTERSSLDTWLEGLAAPSDPASGAAPAPWQPPRQVLFVTPNSFRIESTINVHMTDDKGQPRQVDLTKAQTQWRELVAAYSRITDKVHTLEGHADLPDMVFCANQTLPFRDANGHPAVLLSTMKNPSRKPEVAHFEPFFKGQGYRLIRQEGHAECLEGMGDVIHVPPHSGRPVPLFAAGFGQRTSRRALDWVASQTRMPVCAFELANPRFYHLDTCLSVLRGDTALACREGFTSEGWALLQALFPVLIECPLAEADSPGFACNSHSPDGLHVVIQAGNSVTRALLAKAGFQVIEVDTSEFIKAGGSVFCMKMMFW